MGGAVLLLPLWRVRNGRPLCLIIPRLRLHRPPTEHYTDTVVLISNFTVQNNVLTTFYLENIIITGRYIFNLGQFETNRVVSQS